MGRTQINSDLIKDSDIQTNDLANGAVTVEKININGNLNFNSYKITGLGSPSDSSDAATKGYVDSISSGLPSGTTDYLLRYNGSSWEATGLIQINNSYFHIQPNTILGNGQALTFTNFNGFQFNNNVNLNGNRITNLGNPSNDTDAVNKSYVDGKEFDVYASSSNTKKGIWIKGYNAGDNLSNLDLVYFDYNTGTWKKASCSNINTIAVGISPDSVSSGNPVNIMTYGLIWVSSLPSGINAGNLLYLSSTGVLTATAPTTSGHQVQLIGKALSSNVILFNPSLVTAEVA